MPDHTHRKARPLLLLASAFTLMLLAGCAAELVSADDKLIVVKARRSQVLEATDVAETQCQRRGMHARLTTKPADGQFGFDCVR